MASSGFNPRSRVGSDTRRRARRVGHRRVSIHAPAWGATHTGTAGECPNGFQSTLPRGERLLMGMDCCYITEFQSTLPRGERPHVGCTSRKHENVSIHAPAWGATSTDGRTLPYTAQVFQSTLPRGERRRDAALFPDIAKFQSTLPRGERLDSKVSPACPSRFQSTLPRGERRSGEYRDQPLAKFQSTLPRGERPPERTGYKPLC